MGIEAQQFEQTPIQKSAGFDLALQILLFDNFAPEQAQSCLDGNEGHFKRLQELCVKIIEKLGAEIALEDIALPEDMLISKSVEEAKIFFGKAEGGEMIFKTGNPNSQDGERFAVRELELLLRAIRSGSSEIPKTKPAIKQKINIAKLVEERGKELGEFLGYEDIRQKFVQFSGIGIDMLRSHANFYLIKEPYVDYLTEALIFLDQKTNISYLPEEIQESITRWIEKAKKAKEGVLTDDRYIVLEYPLNYLSDDIRNDLSSLQDDIRKKGEIEITSPEVQTYKQAEIIAFIMEMGGDLNKQIIHAAGKLSN